MTLSVGYLGNPSSTSCGIRLHHLLPGKGRGSQAPQQWGGLGLGLTFPGSLSFDFPLGSWLVQPLRSILLGGSDLEAFPRHLFQPCCPGEQVTVYLIFTFLKAWKSYNLQLHPSCLVACDLLPIQPPANTATFHSHPHPRMADQWSGTLPESP